MKKFSPLLFCLLCSAISPAKARIGETLEQCIARYGNPVRPIEERMPVTFQKSGLLIGVVFIDGKAAQIMFFKPDQTDGKLSHLSADEIKALLDANGAGRAWSVSPSRPLDKAWTTADGELFAVYLTARSTLTIRTKAFDEASKAKAREDEKKALEGF